MAQDVRELLDHLELGAVDLVGHSMGAITALLVAASDPRVRRLSLSGVGDGVLEVGGLDQRQMPGELLAQGLRADTDEEVEHPLGSAWRSFARTLDGNLPALASQAAAMHTGGVDLGAIMASAQLLLGSADNSRRAARAARRGARRRTDRAARGRRPPRHPHAPRVR